MCGSGIYHSSSKINLNKEKRILANLEYGRLGGDDLSNLISKNRYILKDPRLSNIKMVFDEHVQYYLNNVLGINNEVKELNSWVTINKQNDYHHSHTHPNVFISLCYYPQVESGELVFRFPKSSIQNIFNLNYNIIKFTPFNSSQLHISLKTNDIVIFPGDLEHSSTPNKLNTDRVMIGANYFLKGVLGSDDNVNFIEF